MLRMEVSMHMTSPYDSRREHPSLGKERPDPEAHILGSIMGDPALLEYVAPRIKPEYFQGELHRRIYRAMLYKHEHGISPNLQCLSNEVRPSGLRFCDRLTLLHHESVHRFCRIDFEFETRYEKPNRDLAHQRRDKTQLLQFAIDDSGFGLFLVEQRLGEDSYSPLWE
jgi:hypothetical protein